MTNTSIFALLNSVTDEKTLLERMPENLDDAYVKAKDKDGRTALHLLAQKGYAQAIEKLIYHGAMVDAPSRFGTPLEIGIKAGHLDVAKMLVWHQADLKQRDKDYFAPLHWAAKTPDAALALKLVNLLLREGASIDISGGDRMWPLHIAVVRGELALVKKLLSAQVMDAKSPAGKTPLQLACEHGHTEIIDLLIEKGADINCNHGSDSTKLVDWAVANKKDDLVNLLLDKGVGVQNCYQLLYWASKNDRHEIIEKNQWHNLDKPSAKGWTALEYAAFAGSLETVKKLIAAGAKVNYQDKFGHSPLEIAAYKGHTEIVELLIASGARVDIQDMKGYTPLMEAIKTDHKDTAEALIKLGAAWEVQDKNDWSAVDWVHHQNAQDSYSIPDGVALGCLEDDEHSSDHLDIVNDAFERGEW